MADRLSKLEKAYRRHPDLPLFARLADLYLQRGMVFRALDICEKGCAAFPDYTTGFLMLSKCHEARGELEAARKALGRALRLDAENPVAFKRLARIYQELGNLELASKSLEQVARIDPLDCQVREQVDQLSYAQRRASVVVLSEQFDTLPQEVGEGAEPGPLPKEADAEPSQLQKDESPEPLDSSEYNDQLDASIELDEAALPAAVELQEAVPEPEEESVDLAALAAALEKAESSWAAAPDDAAAADMGPEVESASEAAGEEEGASVNGEAEPTVCQEDEPIAESPVEAAAQSVVEPADEPAVEAPPSRKQRESSASTVSGLAPRDDAELLRIFQEIENQQPQNFADRLSGAASPIPSVALDDPKEITEEAKRRIATVTLAQIYTAQGLVQRAIEIYQEILEHDPDNEEINRKLAALQQKAEN